jgi:hypothetical protein
LPFLFGLVGSPLTMATQASKDNNHQGTSTIENNADISIQKVL